MALSCYLSKWASYAALSSSVAMLCGLLCSVSAHATITKTSLPDPAVAKGVAPHKALYDVKLSSVKSGSQIINIDGKMYFEWKPACDGWITNHRFNLFYEYADAPAMRLNSDFTTYESFDGRVLNFSSRRKRDGELYEELRGNAALGEKGAGTARYSIPQELSFDLSSSTIFPMKHTLALVDAVHTDRKFVNATVFDGSDEEGPVEINAFIGRKMQKVENEKSMESTVPATNSKIQSDLLKNNSWNIRMAFFPVTSTGESSDYEMTMKFHENGVISNMKIEYADFSVTQNLIALEKLPVEGCTGAQSLKPHDQ